MPFSNGIRIEHVLILVAFLFARHALGTGVSDEGEEDGEHHEEGYVVSIISTLKTLVILFALIYLISGHLPRMGL